MCEKSVAFGAGAKQSAEKLQAHMGQGLEVCGSLSLSLSLESMETISKTY